MSGVNQDISLRYQTYVCSKCGYYELVAEVDADPKHLGIWLHLERHCPKCGGPMENKTMVRKIVDWLRHL